MTVGGTRDPFPRRGALLLLAAAALLYFSGLSVLPLLEPDEGRYAEVAREMLASGEFAVPHLNGVPHLTKPPLYYWGTALSLRLFGETEAGARAFTAAVSVAGVMLAWWMGTVLAGPGAGLCAGLVLATAPYPYFVGRLNTLNMALAAALVLATFPAYLHLSGRRGRGYLVLSYGAAAAAFLTKGLVGVVFPAGVLGLWLLLARRAREIPRALSATGLLLFLALSLPWLLLVESRVPGFLEYFFVREHLLRYATDVHHRVKPFWYFLPIVAGGVFPWLPFVPRALSAVRGGAPVLRREDLLFLWTWVLFVLLFFSVSKSKLPTYMAPLFPPLAVLLGAGLAAWAEREREPAPLAGPLVLALLLGAALAAFPRFARHAPDAPAWLRAVALPAALALAWGAVPLFARRLGAGRTVWLSAVLLGVFLSSLGRPLDLYLSGYKSVKRLSAAVAASLRPGDVLAQYGGFRPGVAFYTKRRSVLAGDPGEMRFGADRAPDRAAYFLDEEGFRRLFDSTTRVVAVFPRDSDAILAKRVPRHVLLYRSGEGIVAANRP